MCERCGVYVWTARAKVYVDDAGFTLQPEGGWPRAISATAEQNRTGGSRRRRQQTPDTAADTRPHTQPLQRPVPQVRVVHWPPTCVGVWGTQADIGTVGNVQTDMQRRGACQPRNTTEHVVEVSPAVLRRLATTEKLKVSALRCVRSQPPRSLTHTHTVSHPCDVRV